MTASFPESDWKIFKRVREAALDRLCRRVLDEIAAISADSNRTAHERYQAVYGLVRDRDRDIAEAFDDLRRSRAWQQLLMMRRLGLLEPDDLAELSAATRESIEAALADLTSLRDR